MSLPLPKAGDLLDNRYRLEQHLGSGGIASVFRAVQLDCERELAIKILHPEYCNDDEMKDRFLQEAQALNRIHNEHIVTVYHLGQTDSGIPYMAMELINGTSLRTNLSKEGYLEVERALFIMSQACHALSETHKEGIVHRDLKPENMIMLNEPEPDFLKIIDFGLAKFTHAENQPGLQKLTQTGVLIGSAFYMSPEQCQAKRADNRSDIYSLTVCFWEMLTGNRPFIADNSMGLLYLHVNEAIPRLKLPKANKKLAALQAFIDKGMSKDPKHRFQDMDQMALEIENILNKASNAEDMRSSADLDKESSTGVSGALKLKDRARSSAAGSNAEAAADRNSRFVLLAFVLLIILGLASVISLGMLKKETDHIEASTFLQTKPSHEHKQRGLPLASSRLTEVMSEMPAVELGNAKRLIPLYQRELVELDSIIATKPNSAHLFLAYFLKSVIESRILSDPEQRKQTLAQALKYSKIDDKETVESIDVYIKLSRIYAETGNKEKAIQYGQDAVRLRKGMQSGVELPSLPLDSNHSAYGREAPSTAFCVLAQVYREEKRYAESLKTIDEGIESLNGDPLQILQLTLDKLDALRGSGRKEEGQQTVLNLANKLFGIASEFGESTNNAPSKRSFVDSNVLRQATTSDKAFGQLVNMARSCQAMGEFETAIEIKKKVLLLIDSSGYHKDMRSKVEAEIAELEHKRKS